jgi:hypothetical protein
MCSFACPYHNGRSNSFSSAVGLWSRATKENRASAGPRWGPFVTGSGAPTWGSVGTWPKRTLFAALVAIAMMLGSN